MPSPHAIQTPQALPLVSICTVTYNRRPLLSMLESCLLAQDYPLSKLEWVIVDDSTTGALPDLQAAVQAGIQLVWHGLDERLPLGAKRNLANSLAHGEVIVVMDDDDFYPPSRIRHAVERLHATGARVAGCDRLPLLLLPESSRWLSRSYGPENATANSLAYLRRYLEAGHCFDPQAQQAEEPSFLQGADPPLLQLDPFLSVVCIGHGANTVDKRTWIAAHGGQGFELLSEGAAGFPPQAWVARYCATLGLPLPITPPLTSGNERQSGDAAEPSMPWRVAVITPYHNEPLALIKRAHVSVREQTIPCVHVLVADGPGREEVARMEGRHLALGLNHADNGNTPRSIGALLAMNEGFTCIAFLDADNWFSPDHIERALRTQEEGNLEVVFTQRHIVFPNGQRLLTPPLEDGDRSHADTSCMVLFANAFSALVLWAQMPAAYAPMCDRVFFRGLMARHRCGWSAAATVFFESWYWGHFLAAGVMPPLNAKFLPCRNEAEWDDAAAAFRQRSALPVYPGPTGIAPPKPRLNLVTILGSPTAGTPLLQWHLCHHFSFSGIPVNHFLWQAVKHFGPDHRQRLPGAQLLAALTAEVPEASKGPCHDWAPIPTLQAMLQPERHYTLLEAYFRVVVSLTSPEAKRFSREFGSVHILDCSPTLALVADVLMACLPHHQAVLLLRDPVRQVMELRGRHRQAGQNNGELELSLLQICADVLDYMLIPLRNVPAQQLKIVNYRNLQDNPQDVVAQVGSFLGLEVNPLGATTPLPASMVLDVPRSCVQQWQAMTAQLAQTLGQPELASSSDGIPLSPEQQLTSEEKAELEALFTPLQPWFSSDRETPLPDRQQTRLSGCLGSLAERVDELAQLLRCHALTGEFA
jgi:glycosyltransferase involved in cell wall biosynthesis